MIEWSFLDEIKKSDELSTKYTAICDNTACQDIQIYSYTLTLVAIYPKHYAYTSG